MKLEEWYNNNPKPIHKKGILKIGVLKSNGRFIKRFADIIVIKKPSKLKHDLEIY